MNNEPAQRNESGRRLFRQTLVAVLLGLLVTPAYAGPPPPTQPPTPKQGARFVVLDAACLKAARQKQLTRDTFGLPGELYLDGLNRKLSRTFTISQPRPRADGSKPGGIVRLEIVLGAHGQLCGYRPVGKADPALMETAATHLRAIAPFPPMPKSISSVADGLHFVQKWTYRGTPSPHSSSRVQHRIDLQGGGDQDEQSVGARYRLGIPIP